MRHAGKCRSVLPGGETGIDTRRDPDRVRGVDIAFVSRQRQPKRPERFLTIAPELMALGLIVEIISPGGSWQDLRAKLSEYCAIGVDRVWVVEPNEQSVLVCSSPMTTIELGKDELLKAEGPLVGFEMRVDALFED